MVHRGLYVAQYQQKLVIVELFLLFLIKNNRSQILNPACFKRVLPSQDGLYNGNNVIVVTHDGLYQFHI